MLVPNIVNITYGRGVGYSIEEEVFNDDEIRLLRIDFISQVAN